MIEVNSEIPVVVGTVSFEVMGEEFDRPYILPVQRELFTGERNLEVEDYDDEEPYLNLINSDPDIILEFDENADRLLGEMTGFDFTQLSKSKFLGIIQ